MKLVTKAIAILTVASLCMSGDAKEDNTRSLLSSRGVRGKRVLSELTGDFNPVCSKQIATYVYEQNVPTIINLFNHAWGPIARNVGLDPIKNVKIPNIKVPCKDFGQDMCDMELAKCDEAWLSMDFNYLDGLAGMIINNNTDVGTISASTTGCLGTDLPPGATCGYAATPQLEIQMNKEFHAYLEIKLSNINTHAKCSTLTGHTQISGIPVKSIMCQTYNIVVDSPTNVCGSSCNIFSMNVTDMKMNKKTKFDCTMDGLPIESIPNWVQKDVVAKFDSTIYNAVEPTLVKEVNKELKNIIGGGIPMSSCPTPQPTLSPTLSPTTSPTLSPTSSPTPAPTLSPTTSPTQSPTWVGPSPCTCVGTCQEYGDPHIQPFGTDTTFKVLSDASITLYEIPNQILIHSETDSNGNTVALWFGDKEYKASSCKKEGWFKNDTLDMGPEFGIVSVDISCSLVHSEYHLDTVLYKTDARDYADFMSTEKEINADGYCLPGTTTRRRRRRLKSNSKLESSQSTTTCSCQSTCTLSSAQDVVSFANEDVAVTGSNGDTVNIYTKQSFAITGTVQDGKVRTVYFYGNKIAAPRNCDKVGQVIKQQHTWSTGDTLVANFICEKDSTDWFFDMELVKNDVVPDGSDDTFFTAEKSNKSNGLCTTGI